MVWEEAGGAGVLFSTSGKGLLVLNWPSGASGHSAIKRWSHSVTPNQTMCQTGNFQSGLSLAPIPFIVSSSELQVQLLPQSDPLLFISLSSSSAAVTDRHELGPERDLLLPERGEPCFICSGPRDPPSVCLSSSCPSTPRCKDGLVNISKWLRDKDKDLFSSSTHTQVSSFKRENRTLVFWG